MSLRVLIVDDEPLAREGIKMLLDSGFAGNGSRNGREAVARIRAEKPDLVLLDVQMPRMDGFAVIEAVGADHMPAVILSPPTTATPFAPSRPAPSTIC